MESSGRLRYADDRVVTRTQLTALCSILSKLIRRRGKSRTAARGRGYLFTARRVWSAAAAFFWGTSPSHYDTEQAIYVLSGPKSHKVTARGFFSCQIDQVGVPLRAAMNQASNQRAYGSHGGVMHHCDRKPHASASRADLSYVDNERMSILGQAVAPTKCHLSARNR